MSCGRHETQYLWVLRQFLWLTKNTLNFTGWIFSTKIYRQIFGGKFWQKRFPLWNSMCFWLSKKKQAVNCCWRKWFFQKRNHPNYGKIVNKNRFLGRETLFAKQFKGFLVTFGFLFRKGIHKQEKMFFSSLGEMETDKIPQIQSCFFLN